MNVEPWAAKYIGIPYIEKGCTQAGLDCLGLMVLIYDRELGLYPPDYCKYDHGDYQTIENVFIDNSPEWESLAVPARGCLIMFTIAGMTTHVGIYIGDGRFIHSLKGQDSTIERLDSMRWENRIEGFYKWNN